MRERATVHRTHDRKSAVSRNSLSHGLSANQFTVPPHENPGEYQALIEALLADHKLQGTTQLASSLANWFKEDCSKDQVLLELSRYESSARRAWYRAEAEYEFHRTLRQELAIPILPTLQNDKTNQCRPISPLNSSGINAGTRTSIR